MYILKEAKQVGTLYHITGIQGFDFIKNNNKIESYYYSKISTTRNKLMFIYPGQKPDSLFKVSLNGDKLSNKYKIEPAVDKDMAYSYDEQEEIIKTSKINNVSQYIENYYFNCDLYNKDYREIFDRSSYVRGEDKKYYKQDLLNLVFEINWIGQFGRTFKKINIIDFIN